MIKESSSLMTHLTYLTLTIWVISFVLMKTVNHIKLINI